MPKELPTPSMDWSRIQCYQKDGIPLLCSMPDQGQGSQRSPRRTWGLPTQGMTTTWQHEQWGGQHGDHKGNIINQQDTQPQVGQQQLVDDVQETQILNKPRNQQDTPHQQKEDNERNEVDPQEDGKEQWQNPLEWIYLGHGEWTPQEESLP